MEYILYPNSVILITFDTYKLRLSECVRISVMAFHNCKIDSTECCSLFALHPTCSGLVAGIVAIVVVLVPASGCSHQLVMSCSIFKILRFYDFIPAFVECRENGVIETFFLINISTPCVSLSSALSSLSPIFFLHFAILLCVYDAKISAIWKTISNSHWQIFAQ